MAVVGFIRPLDQPPGTRRLLADLRTSLRDTRFNEFRLIVAYAKSGPFNRLRADLEKWRQEGKKIEAIIGIDQRGTSYEALGLALSLFDAVYVTQESAITFHPKIYLFGGEVSSRAFIGSNNFTVGGTETNFEAAVQLDLDSSKDASTVHELEQAWIELLPGQCVATRKLDGNLLAKLFADGDVLEERAIRVATVASLGGSALRRPPRSGLVIKPPSALPKTASAPSTAPAGARAIRRRGRSSTAAPVPIPATARGLAIQIKPHHNGEIFLSVVAAREYPTFLQWPFTGATTPKKVGNPTYPQRVPDPVVTINVYGSGLAPLLTLNKYNLNTIYYEKKSEIRVTASPLVGVVPDYSVMIMETSTTPGIDYDITIHTPASKDYAAWLHACNRTMPGGGKTARKYGWF